MREEAEAAADRASESAVAEIMDSDLDMAEKVRAAAEQPLDSDRMQADVDAAMNNPANWRRDEGGPETRPDDEYICIEIDPRTGRRPGT
jgi:hypothetical protein